MLDRLGTFAKHSRTQFFIERIQGRAFDLQTQISSGKKSQDYSGIYQDANRLVRSEATLGRTEQFLSTIRQVSTRMNTMETQLNSMMDNAIQMRTTLITALNNGNSQFMALGQQADQLLTQTANLLNTADGDVYLFSGSRTDTPPVDVSQFTASANAVTPDFDYYQGDDDVQFARIDKDFVLDYGIKANDPTFEKYIRALRMIAQNPTDDTNLRNAMDLINTSIEGLNKVVSDIGAKSKILEVSQDRHLDNKTALKSVIGDLEDTNIMEATSRLSAEETMLQAAYMTISRIGRLSLAQYLN
jgi:flagellar hook-associated protein 3 FlgL